MVEIPLFVTWRSRQVFRVASFGMLAGRDCPVFTLRAS
jgi:hypothetical protein